MNKLAIVAVKLPSWAYRSRDITTACATYMSGTRPCLGNTAFAAACLSATRLIAGKPAGYNRTVSDMCRAVELADPSAAIALMRFLWDSRLSPACIAHLWLHFERDVAQFAQFVTDDDAVSTYFSDMPCLPIEGSRHDPR